ncbi:hypothetical protein [Dyadobacter fanqingshengii]|uniref:Uncharacterized protein n=1 Tax=Dyadobacter fanqingshengii TaxID=2906443 RepID=A0A9X1PEG5_9BACT|nr:hypothetical protein [Dyadobacter fanqingshengii]MCF0043696.1 hypothetical protein [Dyadobacter fanqingshengii]MCF2507107.1 hypothetical protein [Dyadobacter fanqingshengii]USJ34932.1 hypothetical protein NFI81_19780 [Dyadobacter fanqingshengii]
MKGISYLIDDVGQKTAVVIDFDLLKQRDSLLEILEDIEDEIAIDLRKNEESSDWDSVRAALISKD